MSEEILHQIDHEKIHRELTQEEIEIQEHLRIAQENKAKNAHIAEQN